MSTISKFLAQPPDNFSTQIASSTVATDALSVSLDSTTGLPTEGIGQFFKKDAQGDLVSGSVEFVHWTNVSGNTMTFSDVNDRGIAGSDSSAQAYVADDYFEVWSSSYYVAGYGGLTEHNSDGTHSAITATSFSPRSFGIQVIDAATDTTTGNAKAWFEIPPELNGMNLTAVRAVVYTAGTTGTTDIQIRNHTDTADMLSTVMTIDSGETSTSTAATPAVIDTGADDVVTGDVIAVDVDAVSTTEAKGLWVYFKFETP